MEDQKLSIQQQAIESLNELFKKTSHYFTLTNKLLIYRLMKRGHVRIVDLAKDADISETRLYQIVEEITNLIEKGELPNEKL